MRADVAWALRTLGPSAELVRMRRMPAGPHIDMHALEVENRGFRLRLVLRRYIDGDWLHREPDLAAREAKALEVLADATGVRAPKLVAVDPDGRDVGSPAVLMSHLGGRALWQPPSIARLAAVLPPIHAVRVPPGFRRYRPYRDPADAQPPVWSSQPKLWARAYEVANETFVDDGKTCFIHRDHHAGNVVWSYGRVAGVVDWVEACVGPPAVDVARVRMNLAAQLGVDAARRYARCPGVEVDPRWDLVDACDCGSGGLPGPYGRDGLEAFVADALSELG